MAKTRVLIVDDELETAEEVREALHESAPNFYEIDTSQSVDLAYAMVLKKRYDILIVDDYLGEATRGTDLLTRLHNLPIHQLPDSHRAGVVMFTGKDLGRPAEAMRAGAYRYFKLGKPASATDLHAAIQIAAEEGRGLSLQERLRSRLPELRETGNDTKALFRTACSIAAHLFDVERSGIIEFPPNSDKGYEVALYPEEQEHEPLTVPITDAPAELDLVRNRKPILYADLRKTSARRGLGEIADRFVDQGILSLFVVPIVVNSQVVASISLDSAQVKAYTAIEQEQFNILADHIASAYFFRRVVSRLEALNHAAKNFLEGDKSSDVSLYDLIVRNAAELMESFGSQLYLVDKSYGEMRLAAEITKNVLLPNTRTDYGSDIIQKVSTSDTQDHFTHPDYGELFDGLEERPLVRGVLAVSLATDQNLFGTLIVYETSVRVFTVAEIEVLKRFAAMAAVELQRHQELLRQVQQNRNIQEIARLVQADSVSSDDILHAILTGITSNWGFGLNRACLFLIQRAPDGARYLSGRAGVGFLTVSDLRKNWEDNLTTAPQDFEDYWSRRKSQPQAAEFHTPLSTAIKKVELKLDALTSIALAKAVDPKSPKSQIIAADDDVKDLPSEFTRDLKVGPPAVLIPIVDNTRDELLGLIVADNLATKAPISVQTISSVRMFATVAVLAYRNARQRQLAEAVASIRQGSSRDDALRRVVKAACEYLQCDIASLYVYDPTSQNLEDPPIITKAGNDIEPHTLRRREITAKSVPDKLLEQLRAANSPGYILLSTLKNSCLSSSTFAKEQAVKSVGATLLSVHGDVVGLLIISFLSEQVFTVAAEEDLQRFADQIAFALRGTVQYSSIIEEQNRLRRLYSASKALIQANDDAGRDILREIVNTARQAAQANIVSIYIIDDDGRIVDDEHSSVSPLASRPISQRNVDSSESSIRPDGHRNFVMKHREAVSFEDIEHLLLKDGEFFDSERKITLNPRIVDLKYRAFFCLPLQNDSRKQPLGVMWVGYKQPRRFSDFERLDLQHYAEFATAAYESTIENSKRFTALETLINATDQLMPTDETLSAPIRAAVLLASKMIEEKNGQGASGYNSLFGTLVGERIMFFSDHNLATDVRRLLKSGLSKDENRTPYIDLEAPDHNPDGRIGVVGRAIKDEKAILVQSLSEDPDALTYLSGNGSQIAVPVWSHHRIYGVLSIEHPRKNALVEEDKRVLRALANFLGLVISNKTESERSQSIFEAAMDILDTRARRNENEILERVAHHARSMMLVKPHLEQSFCYLVQKNTLNDGNLSVCAFAPQDRKRRKQIQKAYDTSSRGSSPNLRISIVEDLFETASRFSRFDNKLESEQLYSNDVMTTNEDGFSQLSCAIFVTGSNVPYAVITSEHPTGAAFTAKDRNLLHLLAELAGLAISNCLQFQDLQTLALFGITSKSLLLEIDDALTDIATLIDPLRDDFDQGILRWNSVKATLKTVEAVVQSTQATVSNRDLAYLVTKRFRKNVKWVNISDALAKYMHDTWEYSGDNFTCNFFIDPALTELKLRTDLALVKFLVDQLLTRAINAGSSQVRVEITISSKQGKPAIGLTVTDNSVIRSSSWLGMPSQRLDRQGQGLDIAVLEARVIAELLDGELILERSSSDGTTLAIYLPVVLSRNDGVEPK